MTQPPQYPPPGPQDPRHVPLTPPTAPPPGYPGAHAPVQPSQPSGRGHLAFDRADLPTVLVAVGVALVAAAVVVSTVYSRLHDDLDWSNFVVGVLSTLGLLGIAAAAYVLAPDAEERTTLVSWPGAFGVVALGLMISVAVTNDTAATYVSGVVITAGSAAGYLLVRRAPFVLTTIFGLSLLYAQVFSDLFGGGAGGDNAGMVVGLGVLVFVLAITVGGWVLPATRVLSGVVVGVAGLVAMVAILGALVVERLVAAAFAGSDLGFGGDDDVFGERGDPLKNDVYVVLLYCLVLALVWIAAAAITGHVGFRILVVADAVTVIPLSTAAVMAHHPTWWGVVPAALGGAVLVLVGLQLLRGQQRPASGATPPPPPPPPPGYSPPPPPAMPADPTMPYPSAGPTA